MFLTLISLFHIPNAEPHVCQHDAEYHRSLRSQPPKNLIKQENDVKPLDTQNRENIRLKFYFGTFSNKATDREMCSENNMGGDCNSSHILTTEKANVIMEQFEIVRNYLEPLLKVNRLTGKQSTDSYAPGGVTVHEREEFDSDLLIYVLSRPYPASSSTIASAAAEDYDDSTGRPTYGYIKVNPLMVPEKAQNSTDPDRSYFATIVHEINHILSFSNNLFKRWVNEDGNIVDYTIDRENSAGMTQKFLNSPRLTEWVNERFSITDPELKNLGLEIEDGGGGGTAGSHPSARLYFTDLMQGTTYGPAYISPIFFLSLEDSGWYSLDEEYRQKIEEELVFLDPTITNEYYPQKTIIESGWNVIPDTKICSDMSYTHCFYDHRFKGVCSGMDASNLLQSYTEDQIKNWYNPRNFSKVGTDALLDHVLLYLPTKLNCKSTDSLEETLKLPEMQGYDPDHFAETYGPNSVCAESSLYRATLGGILPTTIGSCYEARCGSDYRVRLKIKGKEIFCKKDGQKASIPGYTGQVVCPPGRVVCSSMERFPMVNALEVFPDRGPIDGGNLVVIKGFGFNSYKKEQLTIKLGVCSVEILDVEDDRILCQIGKMSAEEQKKYSGKAVELDITVQGNDELHTVLPEMYTFVGIPYNE